MAKLHDIYRQEVISALTEKFGYKTVMQVPRIEKITLNMGVGEAVADKKVLENAVKDMTAISGQKPLITKVRKSIVITISVFLQRTTLSIHYDFTLIDCSLHTIIGIFI